MYLGHCSDRPVGCDQTSDWSVVCQWNFVIHENIYCLILIVDLCCQLTSPHFARKDLQISKKPQKFPLEHFALHSMPYMVYTAITLLAII